MAEISCSSWRDRLPLYVGGQLPAGERARLAAHLATCPHCQRELTFWQAFAGALDLLDDEIPPDADAATRWQALAHALPARSTITAQNRRERALMENNYDLPRSSRAGGSPTSPRASRRRPLLALTAFVLIVALSATLFAILGSQAHRGQHPTVAANITPAACLPDQMRVSLPPHASIADISMVSPQDGWAVGQIWDPAHDTTPPKSLIARFHDCQWTAFDESIAPAELNSVSMGSADDGWAVGMTLKAETYQKPGAGEPINHLWAPDQLIVLHYTGGTWQHASVPGSHSVINARVRMSSSSAGLMVLDGGKSHLGPDTIANAETVLRYANGSWSVLPPFSNNPSASVAGIAAVAPDDAWVAGDQLVGTGNYDYIMLARYHAGAWTAKTDIPGALGGISFSSPTNGWAVGYAFTTATGPQPVPLILHYDGTNWTQVQLPASLSSQIPGAALSSVSALSDSDVWMLGTSGHCSPAQGGEVSGQPIICDDVAYRLVLHYANGQWTQVRLPGGVASPHDMVMYSATQGFAIGDSSVQGSVILFYNNGTWSVLPGQQP